MTIPAGPQRYHSPAQRPSPYRPPLLSQSKAYSCSQSEYPGPISQQPWQPSKRDSDRESLPPPPQRQYTQQPFCQTFMPQRQNYPYSQRQTSSPAAASRDLALRAPQINLSAPFNSEAPGNLANKNAPRQPNAAQQPLSRQPYQSNLPYRGYQRSNEKGVYQITDEDTDHHPEGFYITFEQEGEEVQYSDEQFDEVDVNFVGIESSYENCAALFSSRSLLHKHLKDGCISSPQPSLPGSLAPTSPIPIITSKSIVPAMGSGLAF